MSITRASVRLLCSCLLVAAALNPWAHLAGEEAPPEAPGALVVEPQSVTLSRFGAAPSRVLVIARDPGSPSLPQELQLSHTATPGIAVDVGPVERGASGDAVWEVTLSAAGDAPDQGFVDFRVRAEGPPDDPAAGTAVVQIWRSRLEVTVEPSRDASPVADAALSIETHFATVDELAPLAAYLKIENTSKHPIRFEVIDISAPPFLDVRPRMMSGGIGAHETVLAPLEMKVRKPPRTGEWLILVRVALTRGEGAFIQKGIALVEHKISVGIPDAADVLKVGPSREASPLDDVDLSIKVDFETINELVPVTAYLLIENTSVRPIRFAGADISAPPFLDVRPALEKATIEPHQTLIVPLEIAVDERPQIGDWLILGRVTLARGEGALEQRGVGVVEQTVTVGVPGVSEVLKLLELPSVLLVPGALILATWSLLLGSGEETKPTWLQWKTSSFWLIAITLSILVFGGLTLVQDKLGIATNFLVAFGIRDAAWLWLGSVGGAAVAYGLWRAACALWRRRREPLTSDSPLEILKKLRLGQKPFYLPTHQYGTGDPKQTIFALEFAAPEGDTWVIPQMLVQQRVQSKESSDLAQRIVTANDRSRDGLDDLIEALEEGVAGSWLRRSLLRKPFWEAGEISHPQTLPHDRLGAAERARSPLAFGSQ